MPVLDSIDIQIVGLLQANARMAQSDIARAVGLAPSAVLERIRKLEARKVVEGYTALVAPWSVDLAQLAFVAVRSTATGDAEEEVGRRLCEIPEVLEVHDVAGEDCYLLKVRARDARHVGELLRRQLGAIPGVTSTRTTIVLETLKETPRLPVADAKETP
jgi:Lrp/AsnC family leucine-responsive transcriptional regulator